MPLLSPGFLEKLEILADSLTEMRCYVMLACILLKPVQGSGKVKCIIQPWTLSLRRFLFMATMNLIINNPEFKAIHSNNVKVKKLKKMNSIMKLCGKLARVLVGMARNGLEYTPEKVLTTTLVAA